MKVVLHFTFYLCLVLLFNPDSIFATPDSSQADVFKITLSDESVLIGIISSEEKNRRKNGYFFLSFEFCFIIVI